MAAGHVSMAHGLRGPNHAAATACATGAHAIGDAFRLVQRGDADVMLAGGTEGCVDAATIAGFARARALADPEAMFPGSTTRTAAMGIDPDDPAGCCRPFDARGGFVMGEGAGVLVLESLASARARGAPVFAEIRGYGQAGDALHVTQPPTDGAGAASAMRAALVDAGFEPARVGYVNAHATGTRAGDAAEAEALRRVFGARLFGGGGGRKKEDLETEKDARSPTPTRSSTKGATGHLLGAAGAVEAAFAAMAVRTGDVPPTLHLTTPDPEAVPRGADYAPLVKTKREGMRAAMSNSFGFGGTNASLVFAAPPPPDAEEGEET